MPNKSRKNLHKFSDNFNYTPMRKNLLALLIAVIIIPFAGAQIPQDVNLKPLKEVLTDIENRYNIGFTYSENLVRGINVSYPVMEVPC